MDNLKIDSDDDVTIWSAGQDNSCELASTEMGKKQKISHPPLDVFALDDVKPPCQQLDDCIANSKETDIFPLVRLVQGHPQAKKCQKSVHLKPVAFVCFNMQRGKAKDATIEALLDSGGAESLVTETMC